MHGTTVTWTTMTGAGIIVFMQFGGDAIFMSVKHVSLKVVNRMGKVIYHDIRKIFMRMKRPSRIIIYIQWLVGERQISV